MHVSVVMDGWKSAEKIWVTGEAGIGKITLAIEYAKRSQEYSTGIFLLDGNNAQTLKKSFQDLAARLSVSPMNVENELSQMRNFLLMYDNVSDISLLPFIPSGHTLVMGANLPNSDIRLEGFTAEDTALYLKEQLGASSEEALLLGDLLDNHPAKLTGAITYIKNKKISIQSYIDSYLKDKDKLLESQERLLRPTQLAPAGRNKNIVYDLNPPSHIVDKCKALTSIQLSKKLKDQKIQIFLS